MRRVLVITIVMMPVMMLAGCRASVSTAPAPPPVETHPPITQTRSEAEEIADFEYRLNQDHDRLREAEILRRLHEYLTDHNLLFQVHSSNELPVHTRIDVFQGQQPIRTIHFTPVDERNLSLLGQ